MHCSKITVGKYQGNIRCFSIKYVWFCFISTCNKPPRRNLGMIPQIVPIKTLKRQYLPKKSEEKSLEKNQRNLHQKSQKSNSLPNKFGKKSKKYSEEKTFTKKSLKRNHYQNISETNIYPKSLKRHSVPIDWKEESLPKKIENMFAKISAKTLYQKLSEEKSMPNKFQQKPSTKKVLAKTFLPQPPWREISTKQFSKETPPKKILDEKIYQKNQKIFEDNIRPKYVWRKISY